MMYVGDEQCECVMSQRSQQWMDHRRIIIWNLRRGLHVYLKCVYSPYFAFAWSLVHLLAITGMAITYVHIWRRSETDWPASYWISRTAKLPPALGFPNLHIIWEESSDEERSSSILTLTINICEGEDASERVHFAVWSRHGCFCDWHHSSHSPCNFMGCRSARSPLARLTSGLWGDYQIRRFDWCSKD
jgi:hypothetical protein